MSGRIKIKPKNKDKKPKIDVFKVIEDRFKNMNELRDMIDMDPKKGLVRIRDGPALGRWSGTRCETDHLPEITPAGLPFLGPPPPIHKGRKKGTANNQPTKKECLFFI